MHVVEKDEGIENFRAARNVTKYVHVPPVLPALALGGTLPNSSPRACSTVLTPDTNLKMPRAQVEGLVRRNSRYSLVHRSCIGRKGLRLTRTIPAAICFSFLDFGRRS
jgi:hypothetical protein